MAKDPVAREIIPLIDDAMARNAWDEVYRLALPHAEQGKDWAEHCIGTLYLCGFGVEQDLRKAVEYCERAVAHGSDGALQSLGVIYEVGGESVPRNIELAHEYYARCKASGYIFGAPYFDD
ncbi:MAG: sel1 repeat family protein [Acidobacteria bacterium]|nr:sel1 repeat family protein [Acidobacteriota bacterium]